MQDRSRNCHSRLPLMPTLPTCEDADSTIEPDMMAFLFAEPRALSLKTFSKACTACPELSALWKQLLIGWPKDKKKPSTWADVILSYQGWTCSTSQLGLKRFIPLGGARISAWGTNQFRVTRILSGPNSIFVTCIGGLAWITQPSPHSLHISFAKPTTKALTTNFCTAGKGEKVGLDIVRPFALGTWDCRYLTMSPSMTVPVHYSNHKYLWLECLTENAAGACAPYREHSCVSVEVLKQPHQVSSDLQQVILLRNRLYSERLLLALSVWLCGWFLCTL